MVAVAARSCPVDAGAALRELCRPVGRRIEWTRRHRGLTRTALAARMGCRVGVIVAREFGEHIRRHEVGQLAEALGVAESSLYPGGDKVMFWLRLEEQMRTWFPGDVCDE